MPPQQITGKVALLTGAASGIGRSAAIRLAKEGAEVIVADICVDAARDVVREIVAAGGKAEASCLDVADESAWEDAITKTLGIHGRLDVLVNNAGISISKPIRELSLSDWHRVMAVNLDGVFLGTRHAIATMKPGGSIINVASVSGITPSGGAAAYCSSKAAVRMFTRTAAIECADAENGIRINAVTPGGVKTPMWEREDFFQDLVKDHGDAEAAFAAIEGDAPSGRFYSPEEVAESILYLASDASRHVNGAEIVLNRGRSG